MVSAAFVLTHFSRNIPVSTPGPRFNIKMLSYQYRKSHCGDKTVERSSYLHNGISYTGKLTSLYWFSPQKGSYCKVFEWHLCLHAVLSIYTNVVNCPSLFKCIHDHTPFLTLNMLNCLKNYQRFVHILIRILVFAWPNYMKWTVEQQYMMCVLQSQYHACWCFGDFRSQCISGHSIDPAKAEYPVSSIRRVKVTTLITRTS